MASLYEDVKNTIIYLRTYYEKFEYTGFSGAHPYENEKIVSLFDFDSPESLKVVKNYQSQDASDLKSWCQKSFEYYLMLNSIAMDLQEAYHIMGKYKLDVTHAGTYTSTGAIVTDRYLSDILENYRNFETEYMKVATSVAGEELEKIISKTGISSMKSGEDFLKYVKLLSLLYRDFIEDDEGYFVSGLYSYILNDILSCSKNTPVWKDIIHFILDEIEKLKTSLLVTSSRNDDGDKNSKNSKLVKNKKTVQRLLQMNGLMPTILMPFGDLIKHYLGLSGFSKISELDKICKKLSNDEKSYGFIVIWKLTSVPLENRAWSLVSTDFQKLQGVYEKLGTGVTQKAIDRSETIVAIEPPSAKTLNEKSCEITKVSFSGFGSESESKSEPKSETSKKPKMDTKKYYYVIETLNGETFRFLYQWHIPASLIAAGVSNGKNIPLAIPAARLENFGIPSRRLASYNDILSSEITKYLKEPAIRMVIVTREERKSKTIQWINVRHQIKKRILEILNQKIEAFTENITSRTTIDKFILASDLYNEAINYTMVSISNTLLERPIANTVLARKYHDELYLSSLRDINSLYRGMIRTVNEIYKKEYDPVVLLKKSQTQIRTGISDMMDSILEEVLKKYISERSNVFLTLENKVELMTRTLLA